MPTVKQKDYLQFERNNCGLTIAKLSMNFKEFRDSKKNRLYLKKKHDYIDIESRFKVIVARPPTVLGARGMKE